jgi:hypothetical protein
MTRPRAADDFTAIRARIEELRRERAQASLAGAKPTEGAYRYSRNRVPAPVDQSELFKRLRDRAPFSR